MYAYAHTYVYLLDFCMNAFKTPNESFMKNMSTLFVLLTMSISECSLVNYYTHSLDCE